MLCYITFPHNILREQASCWPWRSKQHAVNCRWRRPHSQELGMACKSRVVAPSQHPVRTSDIQPHANESVNRFTKQHELGSRFFSLNPPGKNATWLTIWLQCSKSWIEDSAKDMPRHLTTRNYEIVSAFYFHWLFGNTLCSNRKPKPFYFQGKQALEKLLYFIQDQTTLKQQNPDLNLGILKLKRPNAL